MLTAIIMVLTLGVATPDNHDFIFMVENAIKAPSGHNTQPWLFTIGKSSIEIHPDISKSLPVVDPDNRELFISLGCALENLCLAASAKGYLCDVHISPQGVIRVELSQPATPVPYDSLFDEIPRRQTNRSVYNGEIIPTDTIGLYEIFIGLEDIPVYMFENGSEEFEIIKRFVERGNRIQMRDKEFKRELKAWMRFNKKESESTCDGLGYDLFGAPNLPKFISKPAIGMALNERRQVKTDAKKIDSSSHMALFTVRENSVPEWIDLGRKLQRFLLKTTQLGLACAHLNQPNEIEVLGKEMIAELNIGGGIPTIILRIGYADPMPYSKRKSVNSFIPE